MNDGAALSFSRNVIGLIGNRNRGEIIDAEFGATIFHGYVRDLEASENSSRDNYQVLLYQVIEAMWHHSTLV